MKTVDPLSDRPISRRRVLTALGAGVAAAAASAPLAAVAQQASPARRKVTGNMVLATWGGRYSKAMKDVFLSPFSQETGITPQTVDAPGGFVPMLQAQAKAGNVTWDIVDVGEADSLYLLDNGLVQPLPADVKADWSRPWASSTSPITASPSPPSAGSLRRIGRPPSGCR